MKWFKFHNFCPGERISLRNITPVVSKVSLVEISPILAAPRPKLRIVLFDRRATKTWDRILGCDKMGQISKFLPWRENFAPEHDASGLGSIPPGNFTHFGRPTVENYNSVVSTVVRVNGGFDRRVTRNGLKKAQLMVG